MYNFRRERLPGKVWRQVTLIFRVSRHLIGGLFALTLLAYIGIAVWFYWEATHSPTVAKDTVLVMNFHGLLQERPSGNPVKERLAGAAGNTPRQMINNIRKAAQDPRIVAMLLKFEGYALDRTMAFEIKDELLKFQATGKKIFAFLEDAGLQTYMLASIADKLYLNPSGGIYLNGLRAEVPFMRKMLETIGITPQFVAIGKHKTAPQIFTMDHLSDEYRQLLTELLDQLYNVYANQIAANRQVSREQVAQWIDDAVYSADDALKFGLVDELVYASELEKTVRLVLGLPEKKASSRDAPKVTLEPTPAAAQTPPLIVAAATSVPTVTPAETPGNAAEATPTTQADEDVTALAQPTGTPPKAAEITAVVVKSATPTQTDDEDEPKLETISNGRYARVNVKAPNLHVKGPQIAVIYAQGSIVSGQSAPLDSGNPSIGADSMTELLGELAQDKDIKGIILRVDSGGGSATASDIIRYAVTKARAKKPVVVSMAGAAASGGYLISAPADSIVASPLTLTGSIGIFGGKFSLGGLFDLIGIRMEIVQRGKNAGIFSGSTLWSESELERIRVVIQQGYDHFLAIVAEGRKLSVADVDQIAQGRVWTGERALELGLVDQLGGLDTAIDVMKAKLEIAAADDVELVEYPQAEPSFMQMWRRFMDVAAPVKWPAELQRLETHLAELSLLENETIFAWFPYRIVVTESMNP